MNNSKITLLIKDNILTLILLFFLGGSAYPQNGPITTDSLTSLLENWDREAFSINGLIDNLDYEAIYRNKELSKRLLKYLDRDVYFKEQIDNIKVSARKHYTDNYIKENVKHHLGEHVLDSLIENGFFQASKEKLISDVITDRTNFISALPRPFPPREILKFHSLLGLPEAHNLIKSWWIEEDKLTTHKSHCFIPLLQMRDPDAIELSNQHIAEAVKTNGESGLLTIYNRFFGNKFDNSYRYKAILKLLEINKHFNNLSTDEVGQPFDCRVMAGILMEMRYDNYHPKELRPKTVRTYQSCDDIVDDKENISAYIKRLQEFYEKKEQYWVKNLDYQINDRNVKGQREKPSIQYAAIHDNELLMSVSLSSNALAIKRPYPSFGIRSYDLLVETLPIITDLHASNYSPDYNFPIHWRYKYPYFYRIDPYDGNNRYPPKFNFLRIRTETMDSLTLVKNRIRRRDSILQAYPNEKERMNYYLDRANKKSSSSSTLEFFPINLLLRYLDSYYDELKGDPIGTDHKIELELKNKITYDFILNDRSMDFFLRDEWHFSHWVIDYTDEFVGEWSLHKAYTIDSVYGFERYLYHGKSFPDRRDGLPKSQDFKFNSISDLLFYKGHLKCIKQHDNIFIINLEHGGIYSLNESQIEKIAQIDMSSGYLNLRSPIFIEDTNREKLIFLSPVKKLTSNSLYPDIDVLLNKNDLEKMIKAHIVSDIIKN